MHFLKPFQLIIISAPCFLGNQTSAGEAVVEVASVSKPVNSFLVILVSLSMSETAKRLDVFDMGHRCHTFQYDTLQKTRMNCLPSRILLILCTKANSVRPGPFLI